MPNSTVNWRSVRVSPGTIFDGLNQNFSSKPHTVPSFGGCSSLLIGSDYSGESRDEPYIVYAFLLIGDVAWASWEPTRLALRKEIFPDDRRMSYKSLGDRYRREFLRPILDAADQLNGLLICLAVRKGVPSIFKDPYPLDLSNPEFNVFSKWKPTVLGKAFTLLHVAGFLLAGLGTVGQNVFWFTDEDQIVANPQMLTDLTKAFGWISSNYLDFDLGHLRCGTTSCDDGSRQIEDLVCVPDLVAGALSEQFRSAVTNGIRDDQILWISEPGMRVKAPPILHWLTTSQQNLKKHVFVVDPSPDAEGYLLSWFNYGEGNPRA